MCLLMSVSYTGWMKTTTSSLMEWTSKMPYSQIRRRTNDCFPVSSSSQTALLDRRCTTLTVTGRARRTAGYNSITHTKNWWVWRHICRFLVGMQTTIYSVKLTERERERDINLWHLHRCRQTCSLFNVLKQSCKFTKVVNVGSWRQGPMSVCLGVTCSCCSCALVWTCSLRLEGVSWQTNIL